MIITLCLHLFSDLDQLYRIKELILVEESQKKEKMDSFGDLGGMPSKYSSTIVGAGAGYDPSGVGRSKTKLKSMINTIGSNNSSAVIMDSKREI